MNPKQLTPHPILATMPRIVEVPSETQAFLDDIRAHGIRQPILIDSKGQILDGIRRWEAARTLGIELKTELCEQSPLMAIIGSLTQRRHLTKGQLAYISYPLLKPALEESKERRLQNLREGISPIVHSEHYRDATVADLADRIGIGRRLIFDAKTLHEACEGDDELRSQVENSLYLDGVGLGALIAGIAGRKATSGKERAPIQLFLGLPKAYKAVVTFAERWKRPELFDAANLEKTREELSTNFSKLPAVALEEIEKAARSARKEAAKS
jgi:ParB-like chromosome segregation protein Spo0J